MNGVLFVFDFLDLKSMLFASLFVFYCNPIDTYFHITKVSFGGLILNDIYHKSIVNKVDFHWVIPSFGLVPILPEFS